MVTKERTREIIQKLQKELFVVNAELAVKFEDYEKFATLFTPVNDQMADRLEEIIDELESKIELPTSFVIPGSTVGSGWIDFTRSIARRAERKVVTLKESNNMLNTALFRYLNRMADLLFILARYEESC
jgi:cob(I)alamin adenosyltransferase